MSSFPQSGHTAIYPPGGGSAPSVTNGQWWFDVFVQPTNTAGPTTYDLAAFPVNLSPSVALNGLTLREGDDYQIDYTNATVTINDSLTANDVINVRYEYSTFVGSGSVIPLTAPTSAVAVIGQANPGGTVDAKVTYIPTACAGLFAVASFGYGSLGDAPLTLTDDDPAYVWQKLAEVNLQNPADPETMHVAVWGCKAPHTPGSHTTTLNGVGGEFFSLRVIEWADAAPSLNAGTGKEVQNTTQCGASLITTPGGADGVLAIAQSWPSVGGGATTWDAALTDMGITDTPVQGPYFQPQRTQYAYQLPAATQDHHFNTAATSDKILILVGVRPTPAC